jgi:hypothetical protein
MEEKLCRITVRMFAANHQMIAVAREIGFEITYEPDGATCRAAMDLPVTAGSPAPALAS